MSEKMRMAPEGETGERLDDLVGYHLRRVSLIDMNGFIRHLADQNLRPIPFSLLCLIDENPGCSAADLGRMLSLQRANLVHLLAELEDEDLIERRAEQEDKRKQRLFLAARGAEKLLVCRRLVREHENQVLKPLTGAERAQLRRLLAKVWASDTR